MSIYEGSTGGYDFGEDVEGIDYLGLRDYQALAMEFFG